jgi:hypothetical protein
LCAFSSTGNPIGDFDSEFVCMPYKKSFMTPKSSSLNICGYRTRGVLPKKILDNGKKKTSVGYPKAGWTKICAP